MSDRTQTLWVFVVVNSRIFAIRAAEVLEMVIAPSVTRVPQTPDWIRGVINLRGQVVPLIDLRQRLGMKSSLDEVEEFCDLMKQREQDHRKWLAELEGSVRECRPFTLATDPHKCAFGRWYDSYQSTNLLISGLLKQFDAPHTAIHALANEVTQMVAAGKDEYALQIIAGAGQGLLSRMIRLFGELQQQIRDSHREVAVVLDSSSGRFAVAVDSVESVEGLATGSIESLTAILPGIQQSSMARSVGRRLKNGALALILETGCLLDGLNGVPEIHAAGGDPVGLCLS